MTDVVSQDKHDGVSCEGSWMSVMIHGATTTVRARISVSCGPSTKAIVYPIPRECLGDEDEYLNTPKKLGCISSFMSAATMPEQFVEMHAMHERQSDEDGPVYRSLAPVYESDPSKLFNPSDVVAKIPRGRVLKCDSGVYATVKIAHFFGDGDKPSDCRERNVVAVGIIEYIKKALAENQIPFQHLFELDDEGEPTAESVVCLLDQILPALQPGCDLMFCLPSCGEDPSIDACFNLELEIPHRVTQMPFFNFHGNLGDKKGTQIVKNNFYVLSNVDLNMYLKNDIAGGETAVRLSPVADFMPDTSANSKLMKDWLAAHSRDVLIGYTERGFAVYNQARPNVTGFRDNCAALMLDGARNLWPRVFDLVPPFDVVRKLRVLNLVGSEIPESASVVYIRDEDTLFCVSSMKERIALKLQKLA